MKATEILHILKVQNKRLFIVWLVTFIAFIGLLGYTIWLLNDIGTIEETTEISQDNENGYNEHLEKYGSINTTIDRIDVNGNYEPSNCRWATQKEQANNKR